MTWALKRTRQCAKCPWRKDVDPREIPDGYSEAKHRGLATTIAIPADLNSAFSKSMRVMACHETQDAMCVGWLENQAGVGNNLGLRIRLMSCSNAGEIETIGEQHERFVDTLPDNRRGSK